MIVMRKSFPGGALSGGSWRKQSDYPLDRVLNGYTVIHRVLLAYKLLFWCICMSRHYHVSLTTYSPLVESQFIPSEGGDASTCTLASAQDPTMAALKNSSIWQPLASGTAARGRDNYALLGVLRTKPGRADSPPTRSMSCSDKIAMWSVIGIQGALGTNMFGAVYISDLIIGGVLSNDQASVMKDCERAFWGRLEGKPLSDRSRHADEHMLRSFQTIIAISAS